MSDNIRFHSKGHGKSHHTTALAGYHDSATDPIANSTSPFMGDFHLSGCAVLYDTTVAADTSKTICYNDFITYYDGTYSTVFTNSADWGATGNSKWTVVGNNLFSQTITNYVGIGTQTPNEMLTVTDNISALGNIIAGGGNSLDWNNVYSTVNLQSGEWNSTWNTVTAVSAQWELNRLDLTEIATVSAKWNDAYTRVNLVTADVTNVANTSANWDKTHTTVKNNSAYWLHTPGLSAFTSSGSFVCPANVPRVKVKMWGAGGGAASTQSGTDHGYGGGGGAHITTTVSLTPGTSYTVVVGAGGAGATQSGVTVDGGDTTFNDGTTTYTAGGGTRGTTGGMSPAHQRGTGGTATNGDMAINGYDSSAVQNHHGDQNRGYRGGGSPFGGGWSDLTALGSQSGGVSPHGQFPGGGGGGHHRTSNAIAGGDGANGLVIIEW